MEKITIKNIDKILGATIKGRILYKVTDNTNPIGEDAYVFKFKEQNDGNGWNKVQNVHLVRVPKYNTNKYELFVMGLHGCTCIELELKDITDIARIKYSIYKVLDTAHNWWIRNTK